MAPSKKTTNDKDARISQLLNMAWNAESVSRVLSIADQILEINPDNTEALILKADNTKDINKRIKFLHKALSTISIDGNLVTYDKDSFSLLVNYRLAYTYFMMEDFDNAKKYCEQAIDIINNVNNNNDVEVEIDSEEYSEIISHLKMLHYRLLIQYREWKKILAQTMKDEDKTLAWSFARLIAAWETAPENNRQIICAGIFWDTLMLAPDVPFYILNFFEEPDDNAEPEVMADFDFALMFYDTLSISEEFRNWFSRGTILFGLLSGRFDNEEYDYMLDALDNYGGYLEYQKMRNILTTSEDTEVIETLAANKCLTE